MEPLFQQQRSYFLSEATKPYEFRRQQLIKLKQLIQQYQKEIMDALYQDLHKSEFEAFSTEVGFVLGSLTEAIKHLKRWMRTKPVSTPMYLLTTRSFIQPEPLGNILIIGPFNYPFQLVMEPLIGAISAGNTVILKPSSHAPATEKVIEKLINNHFPPEYLRVVKGGSPVITELLKFSFNHIFFTGSTNVGKVVYQAASQNLIPVTLELGGKSPTIVDESANIPVAARRIVFGKLLNAGQTCIAPDYLYVHEKVQPLLVEELKKVIRQFFPTKETLGSIIHQRHYQRLSGLVNPAKVTFQMPGDESKLIFPPTIMENVQWDDAVMKEEIFGPILPILTFQRLDDVIEILKTKDKPLALYLFTEKADVVDKVWSRLSFGNGAVNDVVMQIANHHLPFGGVGLSGIGSYHGEASFKLFSHHKSFIKRKTWLDLPLVYPPFTKGKLNLIRKFFK